MGFLDRIKEKRKASKFEKIQKERRKEAERYEFNEEKKNASALISSVQSKLEGIKSSGVKISKAEEGIERAKAAFNENNFTRVRQLANQAKKTASETMETSKTIASIESELGKVKATGVKIPEADKEFERAKAVFTGKNFIKARQLANQAKKTASETKETHDKALSSIASATKQINATKSIGEDVASIETLLNKARNSLEEGNYENALDLANHSKEEAQKLKETADFISVIEAEIAEIKNSGVITPESDEVLKRAKDEHSNNDFDRAKELATEAKSKALQTRDSHEKTLKSIFSVDAILSGAKAKGMVLSNADDILKKAQELVVKGNYDEAYTLSEEAEKVYNEIKIKYGEAEDLIKSAKAAIDKAKDFCTVLEADELLDSANSAFKTGVYEAALVHAKKADELAKKLRKESKTEIELELSEQSFKPNVWKPLNLILRNTGNAHARGVKIDFSQEVEVKKLEEVNLNAGEEKSLKIGFRPIQEGEIPLDTIINYRDFDNKEYANEMTFWITVGEKVEKKDEPDMGIQIKRGYEVLQNNDLRLGIRVSNTTGYAINDVETILDYPRALFSLKDTMVQALAYIPPNGERTAKYVLTPLGCIHNEKIDATVVYKNHTGQRQAVQMRPKEVHCVCPFLKEKAMREGEFAELAKACESTEEGLSFSGIDVKEITTFIKESCAHRLYVIGEHEVDSTRIINLAGESIGEKAYYLLTAVVQPHKGFTQVAFRAYSDKPHGLQGFLNETINSIRYLVGSVQSAREIGIIENKQVITIIDSVVQRTSFSGLDAEDVKQSETSVNIEGSLVQRTEIGSVTKCPDCGKEATATDRFCSECGTKLREQNPFGEI
jgi:tetratricopeptide (TPR) repeat protein